MKKIKPHEYHSDIIKNVFSTIKVHSFCLMVEAPDHGCLTHKTYTCPTVQNTIRYKVYWNESTLYNFRKSNYVERKTYTTEAAKVHRNCYCYIIRYKIHWNESRLYNIRTSNYVQLKTYTTKALNCYSAIAVT
jgi:hypothetical protein